MTTRNKVLFLLLLALPALLPAQAASTAEVIENLLNTEAVTNQQAAWLVLEAANISPARGITSEAAAFRYAAEQGWLPRNAAPAEPAALNGVSLLIMNAFEIRGGIFFSLFRGPHHAYRELQYLRIIQGRTAPGMAVSGDTLLFMVNRTLSLFGDEQ